MILTAETYRACSNNNLEKIKEIIKTVNVGVINEILYFASIIGSLDIAKYLIFEACDMNKEKINIQNQDKSLNGASQFGFLEIVKCLVSAGIHVKNSLSVFYASNKNHLHVVRYLISVGANLNLCSIEHQKILKTEQLLYRLCRLKNLKLKYQKLIPVYFSPYFVGGKLAKKDLKMFCFQLKSV